MKNFKYLLLSSLLLSCLALSACSGSSSQLAQQIPEGNVPLMPLSSQLSKVSKDLTGVLSVYQTSDNSLLFTKDVTINDSGVSSPPLTLERSTEYRFVLIFYWKKVAIAYVDTTQTTNNDDSTTIHFTSEMITYTNPDSSEVSLAESDSLSADLSAGVLPNLDPDKDTFNNITELKAGTKINDNESTPSGPEIAFADPVFASDGNTLTIKATLTDPLGIKKEDVSLSFDGESNQVLTSSISGNDGDTSRVFTAYLNPQKFPLGDLEVELKAKNTAGVSNKKSQTVTITAHTEANVGPVIFLDSTFTNPTLSGTVNLSFRAYDDDGIKDLTVSAPADLTDIDDNADHFTAAWDTTPISAANTEQVYTYIVQVNATDLKGASSTQAFTFSINNSQKTQDVTGPSVSLIVLQSDNTAKSFDYEHGKDIYGKVKLVALATDDQSKVDLIELFNDGSFPVGSLGTRTPSTSYYSNVLDTSLLSDGTWTLEFKAADNVNPPNESMTTFTLIVANNPIINSFTVDGSNAETITAGTAVNFAWDIQHADDAINDSITISRVLTPTTEETILNKLNSTSIGISFTPTTSGTYRITATRKTNQGDYTKIQDVVINLDDDRDTINNEVDNCVSVANTDQANYDGDTLGDVCDDDEDNDGVLNATEKTNGTNPLNADTDGDGALDGTDAFPSNPTETLDPDSDGIGSNTDNCPTISNADQSDLDSDGLGNACDEDADGDGYNSIEFGGDDCDDNHQSVHIGGTEILDGLNNDCDSTIDIFSLSLASSVFKDASGFTNIGHRVSSSGDFNGDGYADLLIGTDDSQGGAYLIYGKDQNNPLNGNINLSQVDVIFIGEKLGDYAGYSVATAGDVNNDGYDDILISALLNNYSTVSLIYGGENLSQTINLSNADVKLVGVQSFDRNTSISTAGDVNGDGFDDILIGRPYDNSNGQAYLVYGGNNISKTINLTIANVKFLGEKMGDKTGWSVSTAGDVNNDGFSDILIGAPDEDSEGTSAGIAYLIYGKNNLSSTINLANADVKLTAGKYTYNYNVGYSVSTAGDVNKDGYDDLLIGAPHTNWTSNGISYLLYGGNNLSQTINLATAGVKFIGEQAGDGTGFSVSTAGDVNGDGFSDILIGTIYNNISSTVTHTGSTYLVYGGKDNDLLSGTISLSSADAKFTGEIKNDQAGYSVSGAGDVNGDGLSDILIGAPGFHGDGKTSPGKAYLVLSHFGQ